MTVRGVRELVTRTVSPAIPPGLALVHLIFSRCCGGGSSATVVGFKAGIAGH